MNVAWERGVLGHQPSNSQKTLIGLKGNLRNWNKKDVGNIFIESKKLETDIAMLQAIDEEQGLKGGTKGCA